MPRFLPANPEMRDWLVSLAVLAGAYVAARVIAWASGRLLTRAAKRAGGAFDLRLVKALVGPLTYALFLVGAYAALHRLPAPDAWLKRLDDALFVAGLLLLTAAALRGYALIMAWYTDPARPGVMEGPAHEFGPLFGKAGKVLIVLLAVIAVFQHFHVNVASLVISLGVGSLAVGLAAQDTLANMIAGFTLMLDRPFRIGDRVALSSGEVGDVEAIGIRATRIRTLDETVLVVPNSLLVKERLINRSRPTRHITCRVELGVAYGSDLERAKAVLREAALGSPHVDPERPITALVTRFGDSAVVLLLVFQARDYLEQGLAVSSVHEELYRRLAEAGIEIPYPVRRIVGEGGPPSPARAAQSEV
jgi:small-conductance mechanosensitive channel